MTADLPVVAWLLEYGAVSLPAGDPSRITAFMALPTKLEADINAAEIDFNSRVFAVTDHAAATSALQAAQERIRELERDYGLLRELACDLERRAEAAEQSLRQAGDDARDAALQAIAAGPPPDYLTKQIHDADWRIFGKFAQVTAREAIDTSISGSTARD